MKISTAGIATLERLETWYVGRRGTSATCYDDGYGNATVGYGHVIAAHATCAELKASGSPVYEMYAKDPLTKGGARAAALLSEDVETVAMPYIRRYVKNQLTQFEFDALVIFTFNAGGGGLQVSDVRKKINACKYADVADDFTHFDHAGGHVSCGLYRRQVITGDIWADGNYGVRRGSIVCPKGAV